MILMRRRCKVQ